MEKDTKMKQVGRQKNATVRTEAWSQKQVPELPRRGDTDSFIREMHKIDRKTVHLCSLDLTLKYKKIFLLKVTVL